MGDLVDKAHAQEVAIQKSRMTQFKADLKDAGYICVCLPVKELPGIQYELKTIAAERMKSKRAITLILGQIDEATSEANGDNI